MKFEIELDDAGEIVGTLPAELDAILKRIDSAAHGRGYGKGVEKAAEDAKKQIADAVAHEKAKLEALQPLEHEKWARIDSENKTLKTELTDRIREADRTLRSREEKHAEEITKRAEAIARRETRIKELVNRQIKGLALAAGARDESLDELQVILGAAVGFDDDMNEFIRDGEGSAVLVHGKPVALESFVKSYIDSHPHHRKAVNIRGGVAHGGASLRTTGTTTTREAAISRIEAGDRSVDAINELFKATRRTA